MFAIGKNKKWSGHFKKIFQVSYVLCDSISIYTDTLQYSIVIGYKENYIMEDLLSTMLEM